MDDSRNYGMEDLRDCMEQIGAEDIKGVGPFFTNQVEHPIHRKLDRALGNEDWFSSFPNALVTFGPRGSDHSPVILNTGSPLVNPRKPFQFFNHLSKLNGFLGCVAAPTRMCMVTPSLFSLRN